MKTNIHSEQMHDKNERSGERGFILVSVIVLLVILTIIGAAAMMKSTVEVKVSAGSVLSGQALAAANAGLAENYAYWSYNAAGQTERGNVVTDVGNGTATSGIGFIQNTGGAVDFPTPSMMSDLGAGFDAVIQGSDLDFLPPGTPGIRVYKITAAGATKVPNGTWATVNTPQVAVWATSFAKQTGSAFPYVTPNTVACPDCSIAIYALGRAGTPGQDARSLVREIQVTIKQDLEGASALTNAPSYGNFNEFCSEAAAKANLGNASGWMATLNNTVIEVTQNPYLRDTANDKSAPSGVAIKSNTKLGGGGKGFRKKAASTTGATFERVPLLVYSGHGPAGAPNESRANYAGTGASNPDNTVPYDNLDLLAPNETPHNLMMAPTMNTADEVKYFPNGVSQLFNLDAYRWAAEEFVCQDTSKADGVDGNGRYCSKAEALRLAAGSAAPVTGRLTVAEFEYNANYGIPMFGMVRVMMPTTGSGTTFSCTVNGAAFNSQFYNISGSVSTMSTDASGGASGLYDGSPTAVDSDGEMDGTARVLVYGALFFDFFTDDNNNNVFDPAAGERLLEPLEATDSYMKIEFPILVNPAMPHGPLGAFPTAAAGGVIATGVSTNPINLASPTGGYYPVSEGLVLQNDSTTYDKGLTGIMRLMSNGLSPLMPASGLTAISEAMIASSGTFPPAGASALFAAHQTELKYYFDLMRLNAKQSDPFSWPISTTFPANMGANFYIGNEDSVAGNNNGDMFHLLFPSGYMHGWKVALAALNLKAVDWNGIFTNLETGLAAQSNVPKDYGDATRLKGSPFNSVADVPATCGAGGTPQCTWAEWVQKLEANVDKYFYVDDTDPSGYGLLTDQWRDIPGEMYVGGLLDMHAHANINGLVYTPGPLEWEPGNSNYGGNSNHMAYINGAIITGFGAYVKNKVTNGRYVLVYSNDAVDNINTNTAVSTSLRFARQLLK
ncbi:MAG: pilus assembly PilX N-terminal domain-containing protein [Mariprofundaceae bacterium]|nr:pilus assembly PilX N-terminal domain-containing protein [Mariprofundaceae bacterium]